MSKVSQIRWFAILVTFIFAGSLFAQRYPERDHTVFHRPASSSTAQKHQPAQPGSTATQHKPASTTTARAHQPTINGVQPSTEPHNSSTMPVPQGH